MPYPKPGLQRSTLIHFLGRIAAEPGMERQHVNRLHRIHRTDFWDDIRDLPYPQGLRGLIVEERCHNDDFDAQHPTIRRWFITPAGKELLAAVGSNPDALPPANIKIERRFISEDAKELAKEERYRAAKHRKNQEKYAKRCAHPKHCKAEYLEPPSTDVADIDPCDPDFRRLSSLQRVQILRARKVESKEFFIEKPVVPWTAEEWAVVQAQLNPKKVKPAAAKNVPEPQPSLPAPAVKPPAPAPFKLEPKPLTPEQEADHDRRVSEFVKRLRDLQKEPK